MISIESPCPQENNWKVFMLSKERKYPGKWYWYIEHTHGVTG